jgi:DNA polymerase-3 subunit beta
MKFEIEKKDLLSLLAKTQNIVERKNTMPVLVNVLLEAGASILKVYATDLEISLRDEVSIKTIEPGRLAVNTKNLFEITRELSDGLVQLTSKENNWLEIKQDKYISKIVGVNAEEYPLFPVYEGHEYIKFESSVLLDMIDKVIYCTSTDETRYHLNAVYLEQSKKGLVYNYRMVTTDGHRLCIIDRELPEGTVSTESSTGVIVPKKGILEIKKLIESIKGTVEIAVEGSQMIVKVNSTLLLIRLIDGKFPNYHQFIQSNINHILKINKELFLSSIKRVSLLASQKAKGVNFIFTEGKLEIFSSCPELGDAREELEVNYVGKELKVGYNAKYIMDILNVIHEEFIDFKIKDQLLPVLLCPHASNYYTCIIMPMRF